MSEPRAATRRKSVTFDELLGFLRADSLIDVGQEKRLSGRKDSQLAQLVRKTMEEQKKGDTERRATVGPRSSCLRSTEPGR